VDVTLFVLLGAAAGLRGLIAVNDEVMRKLSDDCKEVDEEPKGDPSKDDDCAARRLARANRMIETQREWKDAQPSPSQEPRRQGRADRMLSSQAGWPEAEVNLSPQPEVCAQTHAQPGQLLDADTVFSCWFSLAVQPAPGTCESISQEALIGSYKNYCICHRLNMLTPEQFMASVLQQVIAIHCFIGPNGELIGCRLNG
jgi:hypothetical protein